MLQTELAALDTSQSLAVPFNLGSMLTAETLKYLLTPELARQTSHKLASEDDAEEGNSEYLQVSDSAEPNVEEQAEVSSEMSQLAALTYVVVKTLSHLHQLGHPQEFNKFQQLLCELEAEQPQIIAGLEQMTDCVELVRDERVYTEFFVLSDLSLELNGRATFQQRAVKHLQDITRTNRQQKAMQLMCRSRLLDTEHSLSCCCAVGCWT